MNAFHSGRHEISTQSESPAALGTAPPPTDASFYSPGPRSGKCCVRVRVCVSVSLCAHYAVLNSWSVPILIEEEWRGVRGCGKPVSTGGVQPSVQISPGWTEAGPLPLAHPLHLHRMTFFFKHGKFCYANQAGPVSNSISPGPSWPISSVATSGDHLVFSAVI